jgi:hypothetical protein
LCLTCGCGLPNSSHHDPRHFILPELVAAAQAAGISPEEAADNVPRTLRSALGDPAHAFASQLTLPTIVFDVDDTLAFTVEAELVALNATFDENYSISDVTDYDWDLNLPKKQRKWLSDQHQQPDLHENLAPDWRAIDTAQLAQKLGYPLWVATERPPQLQRTTVTWLERWGLQPDGVADVGPGNKPLWMHKWFGPDSPAILIDDKPVAEYLIPGPGIELWAPPVWTRRFPPQPGVTRLESWQQARDLLISFFDAPAPLEAGTVYS